MADLDPSAAAVLDLLAQLGSPPLDEMAPVDARAAYAALGAGRPVPDLDGLSVEERDVAGLPCIVTRPTGAAPLPVLVWLHGGGWVIGSAPLSQPTAVQLARAAGCAVVNVEYPLAPEHPFPAAPDAVAAVVRAVLTGGAGTDLDPARVAVGGDSAGGNLAAVVAAEVPGLVHQALVYPSTDMSLGHPSVERNGEGKLLTAATMRWFRRHYFGDHDTSDPRCSPLRAAADVVAALPPATVVLAGHDPLVDEGRAYADRLASLGVPVEVLDFPGQIHGFFSLGPMVPEADEAHEGVARALRAAFGG